MKLKKLAIISLGLILPLTIGKNVNAQDKKESSSTSPYLTLNKEKMFKPIVSVQTWATASLGEEDNGTEYKGRTDVSFRRFRFGASGNPFSWLKYSFQLHADRLGVDSYAATKGSAPDGVNIWNAYITAKLLKSSELLNLEAGYFWAAVGRESDTSPWAVASFDKTWSSWYLRRFNTGVGNGMMTGIALGGIKNYDNFGISYRVGTYDPSTYNSAKYASRLYTGIVRFSFGQPEETTYKYMLTGTQWGKRKGVTIGFGGATMANGYLSTKTNTDGSTTDLYFDNSSSYGADIAIDLNGLRIDGEYYKMKRTASGLDDFDGTEYRVCLAYSFVAGNKYLEPTITYDKYEGEGTGSLFSSKYIGDDSHLDFGINWYISKSNLKVALHYVAQDGDASNAKKGDYIGLSCQFKL